MHRGENVTIETTASIPDKFCSAMKISKYIDIVSSAPEAEGEVFYLRLPRVGVRLCPGAGVLSEGHESRHLRSPASQGVPGMIDFLIELRFDARRLADV